MALFMQYILHTLQGKKFGIYIYFFFLKEVSYPYTKAAFICIIYSKDSNILKY